VWCRYDSDWGMLVQGELEPARAHSHGFCSGRHTCPDRGKCHRLVCVPPRVRLQGNIAMAIFVGCAPFQCLELHERS